MSVGHERLVLKEGFRETFNVTLATRPAGAVTVGIASDNASALTLSSTSLSFTQQNWNTAQTVTVTANTDANTDDNFANLTFTPTTTNYSNAKAATVAVHIIDEDAPEVVFSTPGVTTGAITATFSGAVSVASTFVHRFWPERAKQLVTLKRDGPEGTDLAFRTSVNGNAITIDPHDLPVGTVYVAVSDQYWSDRGVQGRHAHATFTVAAPSGGPSSSDQTLSALLDKDLTLRHVSGGTVGCLDVQWARAKNGQNVQTWECNGTNAQKWRLEKRTAGDQKDRYRLVSGVGNGSTFCLDNRGDFKDSARMGIWTCVADTHFHVVNQTFDLTKSGDGWTLTFTRNSDSSVVWAERSATSQRGNVGQRSGGTGARSVWRIVPPEAPDAETRKLTVSDATVTEALGAQLVFTVSLDRAVTASGNAVTVDYATRDGTATAGADYTSASGTLTFGVEERTKSVHVAVVDDNHNDGNETLELVLSNATGATIEDGTGTGTINNADPMPQAWLARFGRTVAEQVLGGVTARIEADRGPGGQATLAGQALPRSGGADPKGGAALAEVARAFEAGTVAFDRYAGGSPGAPGPDASYGFGASSLDPNARRLGESRTLTAREALLGTSFALTGERDGSGGTFALWGRAAHSRFDGKEGALALDGEVTTGMLGADYDRDAWLAGLALSRTSAEGGYGDGSSGADALSGGVKAELTAATAYGSVEASRRLRLWGAAGYGRGELTLTPKSSGTATKADLDWTMAAAGLRSALMAPAGNAGPALALVSDASWARTTSDAAPGLDAADADATTFRLGLEGSWPMALEAGGSLTPRLETGVRHDGGDAESGFGVELGGGLAWNAPASGLSLDLSGRTLLAHEDEDFEDWGVSAGLVFDPAPASQRGLSFTLRHELGGAATGGLDALFAPEPLDRRVGGDGTGRWTAQAAWGLPAFGGRFTGSPYVGVGLASAARDYTLGWRLAPEGRFAPDLSLGLKATRRESAGASLEHLAGVEAVLRW